MILIEQLEFARIERLCTTIPLWGAKAYRRNDVVGGAPPLPYSSDLPAPLARLGRRVLRLPCLTLNPCTSNKRRFALTLLGSSDHTQSGHNFA